MKQINTISAKLYTQYTHNASMIYFSIAPRGTFKPFYLLEFETSKFNIYIIRIKTT